MREGCVLGGEYRGRECRGGEAEASEGDAVKRAVAEGDDVALGAPADAAAEGGEVVEGVQSSEEEGYER